MRNKIIKILTFLIFNLNKFYYNFWFIIKDYNFLIQIFKGLKKRYTVSNGLFYLENIVTKHNTKFGANMIKKTF